MKKIIFFLFLFECLVPSWGGPHAEASCVGCHADAERMKDFGYPRFAMTEAGVTAQTHMTADCADCHLGDSQAGQKEVAHKGMLSVRLVKDRTGEVVSRSGMNASYAQEWPGLEPRGEDRATELLPKLSANGKLNNDPDYKLIIWHDKNPETLAFNPGIAERTCGKCHADIAGSFTRSAMGGGLGAHTQSQYRAWTGPSGPQSCGLWVGSLSKPNQDLFTDENINYYNQHSTMPISEKTAYNSQRRCNQCHVGCLDCHYSPRKGGIDADKGPHTFLGKPDALTCYGGGRAFICHAGPSERRRGDGYIRAEFTQATSEGKKILNANVDVHMRKGVVCVDCHEPDRKSGSHGDLRREVGCAKCHPAVVKAHAEGPHKKVDCASCHTTLIGGYAFNFWTAVGAKGKENPVTRIQDYLVGAVPPVIIKNPKGVWIPVHVVPHTSGNVIADEVKLSARPVFRNMPFAGVERLYYSNDSYAVTGLVGNPGDKDRDTMVWLNLDRVAHATGRSRACGSCHSSTTQKVTTKFSGGSYKDVEDGEYTIIADKKGLRVTDFKGPDGGPLPKGLRPFIDKWDMKGNFALPEIKNRNLYERLRRLSVEKKFKH